MRMPFDPTKGMEVLFCFRYKHGICIEQILFLYNNRPQNNLLWNRFLYT
jgi:hypothetical protein